MTTTSDRALLMGRRCSRRLSAPATASAPKMIKSASCMMFSGFFRDSVMTSNHCKTEKKISSGYLLIVKQLARVVGLAAQSKNKASNEDVDHGDGQKKLPTEAHELVVTEAWQRAAHPDIEQKKK